MKKTIIALLASAMALPTIAAEPSVFPLRLSMMQGDREITSWTTSVGMKFPAEVTSLEYLQYDEACTGDAAGKPQFKKGQLELGLTAAISPFMHAADGIAMQVDIRHVDLNSINRQSAPRGCSVDLPSVHTIAVSGLTIVLGAGQKVKLPAGGSDKYRFWLERL